ncbi:biotin--[acetyl-CoA-carboxylase] ligase [Gracilibacillus dipsosauri]|uniref:Bifunctional ligase/repressor BirA n=2 Tax=Gracilibacillus TaxID=74385 RepID=A0A317L0U2_9BACI|nr:biotin--[acetyl-CoA-carboxylase] ligase [Gracilibacillus dipsosauri]PWU68660.1 biotin--[acetyl-CoA-carboxylase] ligase [Gracilibacillus dipsosauri]
MKDSKRNQLIQLLAKHEEDYISGQTLSDKLGISRTAVWKHINELKKDGYQFESAPRKGYKLIHRSSDLSESSIKWDLQTNWVGQKVYFQEEMDSTQDYAHRLARKNAEHGTVVITNKQKKGRGRMNRSWESNHPEGIWISILLRPDTPPHHASQMTLFTAVSIVESLRLITNADIQIKWPNDLYLNGKKICGILTEMQAELDQIDYLIIGFGINVNQTLATFPEDLKNKSTSLSIETGKEWNRKELIQIILENFEDHYHHYLENGFHHTKQKWMNYAYKLNEKVEVKTPKSHYSATIQGINDEGALIVKKENQQLETIYSAEIHW